MYLKNTSLKCYPRRMLMLKVYLFCISGVLQVKEHSVGKADRNGI